MSNVRVSHTCLLALLAGLALFVCAGCATSGGAKKPGADAEKQAEISPELQAQLDAAKRDADAAPENPEAQFKLGNAFFDIEDFERAIRCYQRTIELAPKHASAYSNLGLCLRRLGHINEAVAAYRAALEITPDDATTLKNLIVALEAQRDQKGAVEALMRLSELQPGDIEVLAELADLLFSMKMYEEASQVFQEILRIDPSLADQYYNLGLCFMCLDRLDSALTTWLTGLIHNPNDPSINKGLAVLYWKRGDYDQAWEAVEHCQSINVELDPDFLQNLQRDSGRS